MFEKFNRIQIFIAAIDICNPFSIFLSIVQIEHRGNRIHAQSVYMKFPDPVQCVCNKEIFYFVFCQIKDSGSPIGMLTLSGIRIFKNTLSVKASQSMLIRTKVSRYPIQNDPDPVSMHQIDQVHEVFRCSIPCSRCIIAGHLVPPGSIKRMLGDPHQLDMRILHFLEIF